MGLAAARARLDRLGESAGAEVASQGVAMESIELRRHLHLHLRYQGTDLALVVPCVDMAQIRADVEAGYRQRFAGTAHSVDIKARLDFSCAPSTRTTCCSATSPPGRRHSRNVAGETRNGSARVLK